MKKRNPKALCRTCPYWFQFTESDIGYIPFDNVCDHGECTRYAPEPQTFIASEDPEMAVVARYPFTHRDRCCGEHPEFWK